MRTTPGEERKLQRANQKKRVGETESPHFCFKEDFSLKEI